MYKSRSYALVWSQTPPGDGDWSIHLDCVRSLCTAAVPEKLMVEKMMDRSHFWVVSSQTKLRCVVGLSIEGPYCVQRIKKSLERSQMASVSAMVVLVVFSTFERDDGRIRWSL